MRVCASVVSARAAAGTGAGGKGGGKGGSSSGARGKGNKTKRSSGANSKAATKGKGSGKAAGSSNKASSGSASQQQKQQQRQQVASDPPVNRTIREGKFDALVFDALRAGASGFLLKDARPAELLDTVRTVASGESLLSPAVTRALIGRYAERVRPVHSGAPAGHRRRSLSHPSAELAEVPSRA